ncbi:unnamed protein product [Polarella glacialis]|uniref:Uncharacterized protein n=1 Tax=Polarella glacialis TaxID=89957 RepID=A0A813L9R9_POLGL|nr:unnamed protein product [Polarella glacialis]
MRINTSIWTIDEFEALLARADVALTLEEKWRAGYLCLPLSRHLFSQEFEARCDVRMLADPSVPAEQRLERAQSWLDQVAPGAREAEEFQLYLSSEGRG